MITSVCFRFTTISLSSLTAIKTPQRKSLTRISQEARECCVVHAIPTDIYIRHVTVKYRVLGFVTSPYTKFAEDAGKSPTCTHIISIVPEASCL